MKQLILSLSTLFLFLFTACGGNNSKDDTRKNKVKYEAYHNSLYNYTVEYPDFLIPQGEAGNQDGQKFFSEDQEIQLLVYCEYKLDLNSDGDLLSIDKAYQEDLSFKEEILNKKLESKNYIIEYKMDSILYTDYVILSNDKYYNIRFEYPEEDKVRMEGIVKHVIKSFKFENNDSNAAEQEGNVSAGGVVDMFPAFIEGFLKDCYWAKNFNSLLRNNDKTLATYIDSKMDVRRYHAPGTVTKLATRAENFGFTEYDDFERKPVIDGEVKLEYISNDVKPYDIDFENSNVVYYQWLLKVPDLLVNMETLETEPVEIYYPNETMMAVYLPDKYDNPHGFYFIHTPNGWKLAFVNDAMDGGA